MYRVEVQNVVFSRVPELSELYGRHRAGVTQISRSSIEIARNQTYCSDSYFNALHESHWLQWCSILEWGLVLRLNGFGVIRIFRYLPGKRQSTLLVTKQFDLLSPMEF